MFRRSIMSRYSPNQKDKFYYQFFILQIINGDIIYENFKMFQPVQILKDIQDNIYQLLTRNIFGLQYLIFTGLHKLKLNRNITRLLTSIYLYYLLFLFYIQINLKTSRYHDRDIVCYVVQFVLVLWFYLRDEGVLKYDSQNEENRGTVFGDDKEDDENLFNIAKICENCNHNIVIRSFHCSTCNMCFRKYHFHSKVMNSCIAAKNEFIYLLITIHNLLIQHEIFWDIYLNYDKRSATHFVLILSLLLMMVKILQHSLEMGLLILFNLSYHEMQRQQSLTYMWRTVQRHIYNYYCRMLILNVLESVILSIPFCNYDKHSLTFQNIINMSKMDNHPLQEMIVRELETKMERRKKKKIQKQVLQQDQYDDVNIYLQKVKKQQMEYQKGLDENQQGIHNLCIDMNNNQVMATIGTPIVINKTSNNDMEIQMQESEVLLK